MPSEEELARIVVPFGWLEGRGMRREEQGMRLEEQGMGREEVFRRREGGGTAHSLPFAPLEMEIAAFFLAFGRLEGQGMRREE